MPQMTEAPVVQRVRPSFPGGLAGSDLLWQSPADILHIAFTFTNRCNLRCVYCPQGTHPDEFHADSSAEQLDKIISYIQKHDVKRVTIGYYGETTLIDGWETHCRRLLSRGLYLMLVSNHARLLTQSELDVMSRFSELQISLDTADVKVLKAVRKAVDARTIIYNTQQIQAYAIANGLPLPKIVWTSVLCSDVVFGIRDLVAMAIACGVKHLNFNYVSRFEGAKSTVNVTDMPSDDFLRAVRLIEDARRLATSHGIEFSIASDEMIEQRMVGEFGAIAYAEITKRATNLDIVRRGSKVYIYGTGEAGRALCRHIADHHHFDFAGFIDSCKTGIFDNHRIFSFEEYRRLAEKDDEILICAMREDEIEANLLAHGILGYRKTHMLFKRNFQPWKIAASADSITRKGIQGNYGFSGEILGTMAEGMTRLCSSPWTEMYFDPKGEVYSCCQRGTVMGVLGPDASIQDILNNEAYRELRKRLLTGRDLDPECLWCSGTRAVPVANMVEYVEGLLELTPTASEAREDE